MGHWSFLFALLWLTTVCPALAAGPAPSDFAYGLPLTVADAGGLYTLIIPQQVYEKVTRADLGDLRVFNNAGEPVPHAIRPLAAPEHKVLRSLPFFPLPAGREIAASDLSLEVRRKSDGAVVTVDAPAGLHPQPAAYLLDASGLESNPTELELAWEPTGETIAALSLHQSSDLVHWTDLVDKAVLADLRYQNNRIQLHRIALQGEVQPYIRLDCTDCSQPLVLTGVTAISGSLTAPDQWHWLRLAPITAQAENGTGEFLYRMEARATITGLQVHLPRDNGLVRAIVESRPEDGTAWQYRTQADFYRLMLKDRLVTNPQLPCPPTADRDWRIRIIHNDAGLSPQEGPQLLLGRRQEQLIFLARGTGEYLLGFGRSGMEEADQPQSAPVLAVLHHNRSESLLQWLEPGPLRQLAGDAALKPKLSPASWTKLVLWGVLLAGVVLLALMIRTLVREMRAGSA